jgi:hypothetical protein
MPYDTTILKKKAIEAIEKNKLIFVEDVCALMGIAKSTFYVHFPIGKDDSNELMSMIEKNRQQLKIGMRKKWFDSDNATLQMALYKLCSTDIEHRKLNQNYTDVTTNNESLNSFPTLEQFYGKQVEKSDE